METKYNKIRRQYQQENYFGDNRKDTYYDNGTDDNNIVNYEFRIDDYHDNVFNCTSNDYRKK